MKRSEHFVTVNNKKYPYYIGPDKVKGCVFFECKAASISQPFPVEDVPELLVHLSEYIIEEKSYREKQKEIIRFRLAAEEKKAIEKKAARLGYSSVSSFLRDIALKA